MNFAETYSRISTAWQVLTKGSRPAAKAPEVVKPKRWGLSLASSDRGTSSVQAPPGWRPFAPPMPPPGVLPKGEKPALAMDEAIGQYSAWGGMYSDAAYAEGQEFLGYTALALMAQRPEYQKAVNILASEMTRLWISFESVNENNPGKDGDKTERIQKIIDEMDRLKVREHFKTIAEQDGYFGRAHLYIDTGETENPEELSTPLGDGRDATSKAKIKKGSIKELRTVEAMWVYPQRYDARDPLKKEWYNPTTWYVSGKMVDASRLLLFVGRPVPDLLKPAYCFGGLSITQLLKIYIDNWTRTRQSITDVTSAFAQMILKTSLQDSLMAEGDQLFTRAATFNALRSNRNLMMIDKDSEDVENVITPLSGLQELQNQALELIPLIAGIPIVKFIGKSPTGLNASAEPELRGFYDRIKAYQESFFRPNLTKIIDMIQLSLFGDIDQDITFKFTPLWSLTEKEEADVRKTDAETDEILVSIGAIAPDEVRKRIINDPASLHNGLDPDDVPSLKEEEEEGLEPKGGRPNPLAVPEKDNK